MTPVATSLLLFLVACGSTDPEHAEGERPDLSVTLYQDGLELFMEYPAFVVGEESPLVAHFTDARDPEGFEWVTTGRVTATLDYTGGGQDVFVAEKLLRSGIFKPIIVPTKAGPGTLTLTLEGEQVAGTVQVGEVVVHPDEAAAVAAAPPEEAGEPTVGYLKESQWKTLYATAPAERRVLRGSVRATGEVRAPAGKEAQVLAPFAGRVAADAPMLPGQAVVKGDRIARIEALSGDPGTLSSDRVRATSDLAMAQKAAERAQRLYPDVISAKDRDAALADVEAAQARLASLSRGLGAWSGGSGAGFDIRAPFDGTIAFVNASPGDVIEAGTPVVSFVDARELWLEARVYEGDAGKVADSPGAMITVAGRVDPVLVDASTGGSRIAFGSAVDPSDRTVPIVYAFPNPGDLLPGMVAKVRVLTAAARDAVSIPAAAVVDDGGFPTVFVMDGGESFFKRRVVLGVRDGDQVEVLGGVSEGERVVSRGGWEIKLATTAGAIPEHGHQH